MRWVVLIGLCAFVSGCASAPQVVDVANVKATQDPEYQKGQNAFLKKDYASAFAIWRRNAASPTGWVPLCIWQQLPEVPSEQVNMEEARRACEKGAAQGSYNAQHQLGAMMLNGRGGPQDVEAGKAWIRRAAFQGHLIAPLTLAAALKNPAYGPTQPAEAYKWATIAEQGGGSRASLAAEVKRSLEALISAEQRSAAMAEAKSFAPKPEPFRGN